MIPPISQLLELNYGAPDPCIPSHVERRLRGMAVQRTGGAACGQEKRTRDSVPPIHSTNDFRRDGRRYRRVSLKAGHKVSSRAVKGLNYWMG